MSLETRLSALITAIGADIKALQAASGGAVAFYTKPRKTIEVFDEYFSTIGATIPVVAGTGAAVSILTTAGNGTEAVGIMNLNTGTDSNGRAAGRSALGQLQPGKGKLYYAARVYIDSLSDGTNAYHLRLGFGDTDNADHNYGVYFEYDQTQSTQWRCCTSANGTRTKVNSGVTASFNNYHVLGIEIAANRSSAKFYINDVLVATITTNIPGEWAWETHGYGAWLVKTLGTQSRFVQVDYQGFRLERTTNR